MDLKEIQALIKFVSTAGVDEVEINQKDFKLLIKKNPAQITTAQYTPVAVQAAPVAAAPVAAATAAPAVAAPAAEPKADNLITIKSPMVGTFYRTPNPESPMFVNVGDEVKPGKVVCIIEAMKLFNEIESEISGKIVKVLVDNATPVEYDQPLFLVEPA
ncbi:MAG: acetyl-CoA carboxylase biotin carboxyl carrier protein [Bacteroidota bacterium]|jgi:acetyl-CoA carboxylase biotin carboxyl carrier protein|nr:acetyl-CoA carboxylase biotin carboxyl carrier protein [Bacteroidota bacterium]NBX63651.1 acetyl-CoA carboxylase biotin carboxyl carrier protein [Bacteroidota bacterium]